MVKYRLTLIASVLLLGVSACAALPSQAGSTAFPARKPTSTAESSGIEGQVTIGPACPGPVSIESPCPDRPFQATIVVLDQNNVKVTQFQSGEDGYFHQPLPPGEYILHPLAPGAMPHAGDQPVTVNAGQYTQVQIIYDSGIR